MRTVFADSFYFFALGNERDQAHARAAAFNRSFDGKLVTTGWILTELGDGWARPVNRSAFLATVDFLRADPDVSIMPCSDQLLSAGIALFRSRPDQEWPLTDCISFVVMRQNGISEALTGIVISSKPASSPS